MRRRQGREKIDQDERRFRGQVRHPDGHIQLWQMQGGSALVLVEAALYLQRLGDIEEEKEMKDL